MRALIVDDSPRVRADLRLMMMRLGWSVVGEAGSGVEALKQIRELSPDLVTLDIIMPEMDGIECYRAMRKLPSPPRCLLISVLAAEVRVVEAYAKEIFASHFLSKPVDEKYLREHLEIVMAMPPLPLPPPIAIESGTDQEALASAD